MRNRQLNNKFINPARFSIVGFQKFFASWSIEKQILHSNGGAKITACRPYLCGFATSDFYLRPQLSSSLSGLKVKSGNRGNARQSLSTKAQGGNSLQIIYLNNFAGSMTQNGLFCILPAHADTIV